MSNYLTVLVLITATLALGGVLLFEQCLCNRGRSGLCGLFSSTLRKCVRADMGRSSRADTVAMAEALNRTCLLVLLLCLTLTFFAIMCL